MFLNKTMEDAGLPFVHALKEARPLKSFILLLRNIFRLQTEVLKSFVLLPDERLICYSIQKRTVETEIRPIIFTVSPQFDHY